MMHCSLSANDATLFGNTLQEFIKIPLLSLDYDDDFRTALCSFILQMTEIARQARRPKFGD
jgi:hypothetical protein